MPRIVFFLILLSITSCIENTSSTSFPKREILPLETFEPYINKKSIASDKDVDLNNDQSLINQDYPIEIWLYANNKY